MPQNNREKAFTFSKRELLILLSGMLGLFLAGVILRWIPWLSLRPRFMGFGQYCRLLADDAVFGKALLNTVLFWLTPLLLAVAAAYCLSRLFFHVGTKAQIRFLSVALLVGLTAGVVYFLFYFNVHNQMNLILSTWPQGLLTAVLICPIAFSFCSVFFYLGYLQNRLWCATMRFVGIFLALNLASAMYTGLFSSRVSFVEYTAATLLLHLRDYSQIRGGIVSILSQQCLYLALALLCLILIGLADRIPGAVRNNCVNTQ